MFCFLQLPYHPKSAVHISAKDRIKTSGRLYQYYSAEMTTEIIRIAKENRENAASHNERKLMLRRSRSEPVAPNDENAAMTSRTDPEWNVTVDSISLKSSFAEYQQRRKERLKKQEAQRKSEVSLSSGTSELLMKRTTDYDETMHFSDGKMPSTLSLTDSDNSHSSNDISSSQAKEINYEEEMRLFIEKTEHLVTNIFADPFDSDERKSRTELWVEASAENFAEEGTSDDVLTEMALEMETDKQDLTTNDAEGNANVVVAVNKSNTEKSENIQEKEFENLIIVNNKTWNVETKEDAVEVDTPESKEDNVESNESLVPSDVTESRLANSKFKSNIGEALEARSEIDAVDVDRFWDYLYAKDVGTAHPISAEVPSTSESERTFGLTALPVDLKLDGILLDVQNIKTTVEIRSDDEQDREIDELLEIPYQTVSDMTNGGETINSGSQSIMMKTTASQTSARLETAQIIQCEPPLQCARCESENELCSENEHMVRVVSFKFSDKIFKDLKILVVERDRAKEALRRLPARSMKELSDECNYVQTRYRVLIEQNKERLDRSIEKKWNELLKMPIATQETIDFISVTHSGLLTLNARRNLPEIK